MQSELRMARVVEMTKRMGINVNQEMYVDLVFISYLALVIDLPPSFLNTHRTSFSFLNDSLVKDDKYFSFLT